MVTIGTPLLGHPLVLVYTEQLLLRESTECIYVPCSAVEDKDTCGLSNGHSRLLGHANPVWKLEQCRSYTHTHARAHWSEIY